MYLLWILLDSTGFYWIIMDSTGFIDFDYVWLVYENDKSDVCETLTPQE